MLGFSKPADLAGEAVNNCSGKKELSLILKSDILAINTLSRSPNSSLSMPEPVQLLAQDCFTFSVPHILSYLLLLLAHRRQVPFPASFPLSSLFSPRVSIATNSNKSLQENATSSTLS